MVQVNVRVFLLQCFIKFAFASELPFLQNIDFQLLDETQYCQVIVDIPDFDISTLSMPNMYVSNQATDCFPTIEIRELQSLEDEPPCLESPKDLLIKDPETTFLFWNSKGDNLETLLTGTFYHKISCNLPKQPYFFVVTQTSPVSFIIEEIQVYSKSKEQVLIIERLQEQWKVIESSFSPVYTRRDNFHGYTIKACYSNLANWGFVDPSGNFVGYNGEIGTMVARKLNLTLDLQPFVTWGVKTKNGSYTGAIQKLKENEIDIGMASFSHLSERLEVTDAGFTTLMFTPELIYWKYHDSHLIYADVFKLESWIVVLVILSSSSILLFVKFKFHERSGSSLAQLITSFVANLKSLVVLDINGFDKKYLSIRIHIFSMALCGAILFTTYTGVLISFFSSEIKKAPITSLESLAAMPNLNLLIWNQTSSHQRLIRALKEKPYLEESINKKLKLVSSEKELEVEFINSRNSLMFFYKIFSNLMNGENLLLFSFLTFLK